VFDTNGCCSTPAASFVVVAALENSCTGTGNGGLVQRVRCHLSSMP
jgi:hypothetical protein